MSAQGETVCVTGATGFIGSWLVKRLLEHDYIVRATVQDLDNLKEVEHLLELPNAKTHLTLWKADLNDEGSFDEAISGSTGVFHVATPKDYETKDPENDVIKPTINGLLDIMRSCIKAKVRRLVFTSSVGAVHIEEIRKSVYDETCWSDLEFCRSVKMNGWYYILSKTLAEQAGWKFAEENDLDFITVIPPLVVGPFITPTMPLSFYAALSPIMRNEAHYSFIKQGQFIHLDDICMAHIFLYENSDAKGRYIASACDATIYDIGNLLGEEYPEYNIPTKFKDFKEDTECLHLSSEKLKGLGFEFKHDLKDMYKAAIETCKAKGLLSMIKPYENLNT